MRTEVPIPFPLSNFQNIWLHFLVSLHFFPSQPKLGRRGVFIHFDIEKQELVNLLSNCPMLQNIWVVSLGAATSPPLVSLV